MDRERLPRHMRAGAWIGLLGFLGCGSPARSSSTSAALQRVDPAVGEELRAAVRAYCAAHEADVLRELAEFLALPNLSSDEANIRRNAQQLLGLLERRGVRAQLLELPGSPPVVYGELASSGGLRRFQLGQPPLRAF